MSRDSQQLARLIRDLLRVTRGRVPAAWLLVLGVAAVVYALAAPRLNDSFGWRLPTLVESTGGAPATRPRAEKRVAAPSASPARQPPGAAEDETQLAPAGQPPGENVGQGDALLIDAILKSQDRGDYESPGGLRYTRGSKHGHRLKHLMAHARDQPGRPGSHGVFLTQDPVAIVELVDEAYGLAVAGQRTKVEREGDRTIYNVEMGRKIGYVGGESGNRRGKPPARRLRIVVEDRDFVTAFPY